MAQQKQLVFADLSERAKILAEQMLDRHYLPASIARSIARTTHETISAAEIDKFAKHYADTTQAAENARQRTDYLVNKITQAGDDIPEILRSAFHECMARAKKTKALYKINPLNFEAAERHRIELELRKKQVALAERRVKVFEERLHLDRKKARSAIRKLQQKASRGESITPKEVQRIRELYGIYDSTDQQARTENREVRRLETSAGKLAT
jgi:hypothetical protein